MPANQIENLKLDIKLLHELVHRFQQNIDEMAKEHSYDPMKLFDMINHKSKTHELLEIKMQQLRMEHKKKKKKR